VGLFVGVAVVGAAVGLFVGEAVVGAAVGIFVGGAVDVLVGESVGGGLLVHPLPAPKVSV
jgi:hypothetical protein